MKKTIKFIITLSGIGIFTYILIFSSFAQDEPFQIIKNPSSTEYHSAENRKYTGVPTMAVCPKGRFWAAWQVSTQPKEDIHLYIVVATSNDRGNTWEEVLAIDPDGPGVVKAYDPQLWVDPDGKLWLFWARSRPTTGLWYMVTDDGDSADPTWSEPRWLTDGTMVNKPIILSTGEWILQAAKWYTKNGARVVVSTDHGQTWHVRGAVNVPEDVWNCDEHYIVERKDGTLWMFVRTTYGIGESTSQDRGVTWTPLTPPSHIKNTTARFYIRRLNSGNLLLVKNGPIDMRLGRQHMMAFISEDDGFTWSKSLLLDGRYGVSYPDGYQLEDGTIYIIYDFERMGDQNILMTSFKEEDVIPCSDKKIIEVWQRRHIVSKGGI